MYIDYAFKKETTKTFDKKAYDDDFGAYKML